VSESFVAGRDREMREDTRQGDGEKGSESEDERERERERDRIVDRE